ncbi:MAG TPA: hypothetical protein VL197_07320 [Nitrospirota bacterium]|nr:hypothetical protein [Nitrospirota bacterium]
MNPPKAVSPILINVKNSEHSDASLVLPEQTRVMTLLSRGSSKLFPAFHILYTADAANECSHSAGLNDYVANREPPVYTTLKRAAFTDLFAPFCNTRL